MGAFVVLSSDFSYDDVVLGVGLLAANCILLPFIVVMGRRDMKEKEAKDLREKKLKEQLVRLGTGPPPSAPSSYTYAHTLPPRHHLTIANNRNS